MLGDTPFGSYAFLMLSKAAYGQTDVSLLICEDAKMKRRIHICL